MNRPTLLLALLCALCGSSKAAAMPPAPARPNILLIVADDLGYADLGCQGSEDVRTPNIDSLAAAGVRFTSGYVTAPQCSPSRAGLLSGQYQQRYGHETNDQTPLLLSRGGKTLADYLKPAGYTSAMFGKWHLGEGKDQHPARHGFDVAADHPDAGDRTDHDLRIAGEAADFIAGHAENQESPFFVYLACRVPHTPHRPSAKDWNTRFAHVADPGRRKMVAVMADHDAAVGIVLAKLRELKLDSNTLVIYLSDNGGQTPKNFSRNDPFSGKKGNVLEGGIRVPFLIRWQGMLPAGKTFDLPVSALDISPTVLAAAHAEPPAGVHLEGVNLLPYLTNDNRAAPHDALFWRWERERSGGRAVRQGNWKLVREGSDRWRLFDLARDIKEQTDLAAQHPEKAAALAELWERWNAQMQPPGPVSADRVD